ncbi:MAG: condensation domain-containing protein, partial [Cyanobacteria bacterium J06559_3]
ATLWHHHDALRLRFHQAADGWHQVNADVATPPQVVQIDVSHLDSAEQDQAIAAYGSDLHASLNLATSELMQIAHFMRGADQPSWLLLSLHHLIVDAVSWQILHSDLATLLAASDHTASLPAKTTAFQTWAATLVTQATVRQAEATFWLEQVESPTMLLPRDYPDAPPPTEAAARTIPVALDAVDTHALLQSVPAVYNTQINDVLLTALAHTLLQWGQTPSNSVRIDLEAHGREAIAPHMDVSRTVGWFTTTYPVQLQLSDRSPTIASEPIDYAVSLKAIKEQLRQIPERGIGYGMLRYLGNVSIRQRLAQARPSEVLFNYLGQRDRTRTATPLRVMHDIPVGTLRSPLNRRGYRLEINAWIADEQLQLNWTYDKQMYRSETITTLANTYIRTLKTIIAHCTAADTAGFTPSDFPDVDLSQTELDDFIGQLTQEVW